MITWCDAYYSNWYDKHALLRPFATKAWPFYCRMQGFMPGTQPWGTHSFDPAVHHVCQQLRHLIASMQRTMERRTKLDPLLIPPWQICQQPFLRLLFFHLPLTQCHLGVLLKAMLASPIELLNFSNNSPWSCFPLSETSCLYKFSNLWQLVFKGPVARTKKMTETGLNATNCNQTIGCGCPLSKPVAVACCFFLEYSKTDKNQLQSVATGFL